MVYQILAGEESGYFCALPSNSDSGPHYYLSRNPFSQLDNIYGVHFSRLKPMSTGFKYASRISKVGFGWHGFAVAEPILHELGIFDSAKEELG